MEIKMIYATDLDRTLIYSERFIREHGNESEDVVPVERVIDSDGNERIISYISAGVLDKLEELNKAEDVLFVPVTSRSVEEYNRIKLPFTPKYAITSNGGRMFKDGVEIDDWTKYVQTNMPVNSKMDILDMIMDLSMSKALQKSTKIIDNCFIFFKVNEMAQWDAEELHYYGKYESWDFVRQNKKVYVTPKHFSKQVSLRWLWHKLGRPYIVASGDSELDVPMLTLANKAVIPSHSSLLSEKLVESARTVDGGITSPLQTIKLVQDIYMSKMWGK